MDSSASPSPAPGGGGVNDGGSGSISSADIGPNDVLLGRGHRIDENPGNISFRSIVASRSGDYGVAKSRMEKQQIAREVVDHLRCNLDPPGRFLAMVDDKSDNKSNDMWYVVDDSTALEKVKQAMRNLQRLSKKRQEKTKKTKRDDNGGKGVIQERREIPLVPVSSAAIATDGLGTVGLGTDGVKQDRESLLELIKLATEMAKTVRDDHDAGLPYMRSARSTGADGFILSGDHIRSDLVCLGTKLYKLFSGIELALEIEGGAPVSGAIGLIEEASPLQKRERRTTCREHVPLRDLGFPVSLSILVSGLLDARDTSDTDRFHTAEDVEEDLRRMTADPDRYLFDADADKRGGQLQFSTGKIYGREQETLQLMDAFGRVIGSGGTREMLLISGYSGTGKSALVEQLRKPLSEKKGCFISGKLDELGQVQPMSVIFAAFNEYCNDLFEGDKDSLARVRSAIQEALGPHVNVLTDLIPNLNKVMGEPTSTAVQIGGKEALNRFLFYFHSFVQAIASPSHPLILFLDDLQWADKASLELIGRLFSDFEISSLLFVGCYRNNEVGVDHPIHAVLGKCALAGVAITSVKLENISHWSVNEMISDALYLSPRLTQSLADIVYAKTSGNPLFAVQFLRSLCDEHLLQYSASSRRWEWNVEAIQSKDIADNVVGLMTKKMLSLDPEVQTLLKVAACLGSRSEASTLRYFSSDGTNDEFSTLFLLDVAVSEGLMSRMGGGSYKFSHDQIQQAAYSLIPVSEREAFHLYIGRRLWKEASEEDLDSIIFRVVDQLHRGAGLISDHDEKVQVVRLCVVAGEKAMLSSSFEPASIYLLQGTTLLEEGDWEYAYDLSLKLFALCAEAQYVTGNHDVATVALNQVLTHGKCLQDKLPACYTLLYSLGSQGKQFEAVNFGVDILEQLGESFPSDPTQADVMEDFAKTQAILERAPIKDIMQMTVTEDPNILAIMRILVILARYAYQVKQQLMSLTVFRMLQLSFNHGICGESSIGFASYGYMLCLFGRIGEGYQYGKLAISLLDRFEAKEYLASVYSTYGLVAFFREPVQALLPLFKRGYQTGMEMGDNESAVTNAYIYSSYGVIYGRQLEPLSVEVKAYVQLMEHHKSQLALTQAYLQVIQNLQGRSEDPIVLTGDVMNQDELMNRALEKQQLNVVHLVYYLRMWLSYLFRRYDVAAEMARNCQDMRKSRPVIGGTIVSETLFTGLTAVVMAQSGEKNEWRSIAYATLEKIKVWAENAAWNFQHKLDLITAEIAYYLNGHVDEAATAYDDAIRGAGEHGFVHEQALACERAGIFFSEAVSEAVAQEYFEMAHKYYLEWGATRKAEELLQRIQ